MAFTGTDILNIIAMAEQICAAVICRYILLFMPYSIYHCFGQALWHKEKTCLKWLLGHFYFLGYSLLSWCLVATCVIMATQFSKQQSFIRPPAQVLVSPVTWLAVLIIISGHYMYIRESLKKQSKDKGITPI